jgi:hypothetical protein
MPLIELAIAAGDYLGADAAATAAGDAALMGDVGLSAAEAAGLGATDASLGAAGINNLAAADLAAMGDVGMGAFGLPVYGGLAESGIAALGSVPSLPVDTAAMGNVGMGADAAADINAMGNVGMGADTAADINAMGNVGMGPNGAPGSAWDSVTRWWDGLSGTQKAMVGLMGLNMLSPKPQISTQQPYMGGNLQYFKYDPRTYQPAVAVPPTPYTAQYRKYAAGGGVQGDSAIGQLPGAMNIETMDPVVRMAKGGPAKVDNMGAIDSYAAQYASDPAAVMAKAKAGDYNAMLALNKIRNTPNQNYAGGGIANLGSYSDGGRLLKGPGDGMSDNIPATIGRKQPARLADGEFVVPADVVSGLGNGSTDAGAKQLYKMLDKVRTARTGTKKQGKQINPDKYLA